MTTRWKRIRLAGWGRSATAETLAARPERAREVAEALADTTSHGVRGLIAFGAGRSYGDEALNSDGATLLMRRLDRFVAFDEATGVLVAEAGATFHDIADAFLPRGWAAPVAPGTAYATLGGAVANDVHGKNHDRAGSFGAHVAWLDLALPDGTSRRVDPETEPDLYDATIGGVGLTGIIERVALKLTRLSSAYVSVAEHRAADLTDLMARLADRRGAPGYTVAWIDALADGAALGRGIVQAATPSDDGVFSRPSARRWTFPVDLPSVALRPASISAFNAAYWRRVPASGRTRRLHREAFLYPLDAILSWNRLYGKRGFHQFQCVLPDDTAERGIRALMQTISAARAASFLAVLKTLGAEGRGLLSFPRPGFTLALDFPARADTADLMRRLEALTLEHGGRIYLAKDSFLSPEGFRAMYPNLPRFQAVLDQVDPLGRMASDLARRLDIRRPS
jgi:decaprenylphospho-beta-D-ribofuranose 2-oxidase